jgi:signal transduction histidine kinase
MNTPYITSVSKEAVPATKADPIHGKNDQFVTSLIHEVRNPLATIKLAVEVLQNISEDHMQKRYLEMIMKSNERINDIITHALASFQHEINVLKEYPIHQLVEEVLNANADRFFLSHVKLTKNYTRLASAVLVNKEEIKTALTNIIINAIESLPVSDGELIITTIADDGKCTLVIEDNGAGIENENLKNIFSAYFTTKPKGVGLGLPVTLSLLASNEITVRVQSERDVGTRFILSFENRYAKIY